MSSNTTVTLEEHFAIEQFLFREARLLDERKFNDWLCLLDEAIHYYMPTRRVVKTTAKEGRWDVEEELSGDNEMAILSDNILTLSVKVSRLMDGLSFSENPMSRTIRFISNVEVQSTDDKDIYRVYSNIHVNRTRLETDNHDFYAARRDIIQRRENDFAIKERRIVLNETVVGSPNISFFL